MSNIVIQILNQESINEQVLIYMEAFGSKQNFKEIRKGWISKHYNNPVGDSIIFGAYCGEVLAGINVFMPMKYLCNGKSIYVVQSCESGVLNAYRRMGIWSAIMDYAMKYIKELQKYDAIIGFPNYKNSYNGFLKIGWKKVGFVKNYVLIINSKKFLESVLKGRLVFLRWWLNPWEKKLKKLGAQNDNIHIIKTEKLQMIDNKQKGIYLDCNATWIEWKKNYKKYQFFCAQNDNEVLAYYIIQRCSINDLEYCKLIKIINISQNRKNIKTAFAKFISTISKDFNFIRMWGNTEAIQKRTGFINLFTQKNPFIVYTLSTKFEQTLIDSRQWNLSFLDLD